MVILFHVHYSLLGKIVQVSPALLIKKLTLVIMPGSLAVANPFIQRCVIWAFLIRYDCALLQEYKPIIVCNTDKAFHGFLTDLRMLILVATILF